MNYRVGQRVRSEINSDRDRLYVGDEGTVVQVGGYRPTDGYLLTVQWDKGGESRIRSFYVSGGRSKRAGELGGVRTPGTREAATDKRNVDQLAKLFGLPEFDDVREHNVEYIMEAGAQAERDADEGEDTDEIGMKAQEEAEAEIYRQWHDAVMAAAEALFEVHGLTLVPLRASERTPHEYRIVPDKSWEDAAEKIRRTINGVGMFEFASLREFLESGPWTARQAVLSHLGHVTSYPEVYGTSSASRIYESAWR